jgi:hypothetical protein
MMISVTGYAGYSINWAMNYQFQENIPELNYVKEPDSASLKAYILKIKGAQDLKRRRLTVR